MKQERNEDIHLINPSPSVACCQLSFRSRIIRNCILLTIILSLSFNLEMEQEQLHWLINPLHLVNLQDSPNLHFIQANNGILSLWKWMSQRTDVIPWTQCIFWQVLSKTLVPLSLYTTGTFGFSFLKKTLIKCKRHVANDLNQNNIFRSVVC